jgi:hypothetical protein
VPTISGSPPDRYQTHAMRPRAGADGYGSDTRGIRADAAMGRGSALLTALNCFS